MYWAYDANMSVFMSGGLYCTISHAVPRYRQLIGPTEQDLSGVGRGGAASCGAALQNDLVLVVDHTLDVWLLATSRVRPGAVYLTCK